MYEGGCRVERVKGQRVYVGQRYMGEGGGSCSDGFRKGGEMDRCKVERGCMLKGRREAYMYNGVGDLGA